MRARVLLLTALVSAPPAAGTADLNSRLESLRSPGPIAASLRLELRLERTLHHKTVKAEAAVQLDLDQDDTGLRIRWDPRVLREVDAEARQRDQERDRLTPLRDALRELDPARIAHLLDQAGTLAGLTKGAPVEEGPDSQEGRPARRLVYRFQPRLSWTDQYYARRSEGRFTVWLDADATPIASESQASFDGKTSRTFGRFKSTTTIRTRYAVEGSRLRAAEREQDDLISREDGADVEHVLLRFVLTRR
jgi:hypothetical protein